MADCTHGSGAGCQLWPSLESGGLAATGVWAALLCENE